MTKLHRVSRRTTFLTVLGCGLLAGACASPAGTDGAQAQKAPEKPDPRRGEAVAQVCFTSSIDNFQTLNENQILVERGVNDLYLVEFGSLCQNAERANAIKLDSRSACLGRGDTILVSQSAFFNDQSAFGVEHCRVRNLYKWNKDAVAADKDAPEADGQNTGDQD